MLFKLIIAALQVVTSIYHYKINFPTSRGVREVKADLDIAYKNHLLSFTVDVSMHKTIKIEKYPMKVKQLANGGTYLYYRLDK